MTILDWTVKKLEEHDEVVSVEPEGELLINVHRKKHPPFCSAILNEKLVDKRVIEFVLGYNGKVQFVTNVPKDSIWVGDAILIAQARNLGWGRLADLMSAINSESVEGYQNKEYIFVERCLNQHNRVECYERIFDRVYLLTRLGLPNIKVALVYEYELTAEHVRAARKRYGEFSVIVKTNPNGNITGKAEEVGKGLGISILTWGEFLGRLNRP